MMDEDASCKYNFSLFCAVIELLTQYKQVELLFITSENNVKLFLQKKCKITICERCRIDGHLPSSYTHFVSNNCLLHLLFGSLGQPSDFI